jgi:hypothetical protein
LENELKIIEKKRDDAAQAMQKVREIISDEIWENLLYEKYCWPDHNLLPSLDNAVLRIEWKFSSLSEVAEPQPVLRLSINGLPFDANTALNSSIIEIGEDYKNRGDHIKNNITRFSELTRKYFRDAWDELTVLDYFTWKKTRYDFGAADFGKMLINRCNVMITPGNGNAGVPTRNVYLLAPLAAVQSPKTGPFLDQSVNYLLLNVPYANRVGNTILTHADRTTLTYLIMDDGIELTKVSAYTNARLHYLNQPAFSQGSEISRATNHIFAAEKRATMFDETRPGQDPYLVSPRVTMLLEDERLLSDYILAWAYGYLKRAQEQNNNAILINTVTAHVPFPVDALGEMKENKKIYILSDQLNPIYLGDKVEYIVAAESFILRSFDFVRQPLEPMRKRIRELLDRDLENTVRELEPQWKAGVGIGSAISVAAMPEGDLQQKLLKIEARKHMYRKFYADIIEWDVPEENRNRGAEEEFIQILLRKIQSETAHN